MPSTHLWIVFFLFICAIAAQGCASMKEGPRSVRAPGYAESSSAGSIAERARTNTLGRQGSWSLSSAKVKSVAPLVARAARDNNLPTDLIYGVIWVESRFNPEAVSPVGARGLMQLMPQTARYLATSMNWDGRGDSFDPEFNIAAGTYYLARLIGEFKGDERLALAAYNAGPTKVRQWLSRSGLPKVSIEYTTMVESARSFFKAKSESRALDADPYAADVPVITDEDLDRLGLTILIAGLNTKQFGLEREDDPNPFGQ